MRKILDFQTYVSLNEGVFYQDLPELSKNPSSLKSKLETDLKSLGLSTEAFQKTLLELKSGITRNKLSKEAVKVLQMILGIKTDGSYGPGTVEALKKFQTEVLKFNPQDSVKTKRPDGVWGPETAKFSFGDAKTPGPLFSLMSITGMESTSNPIEQAAKNILVAMSGNTEDEQAVYDTFKNFIKTKADYDALSSLWDSMNINTPALRMSSSFWKSKTIDQIKEKTKTYKNPFTLSSMFQEYFGDAEMSRLNQYLPSGVDKF
jgi:hypothetical protein